ncbi:hypothetical protein BDQ12DRAFT_576569, partial [Crucibulum laeve]
MADGLRSDTAQIVAVFVESIFYGLFLVTFFYCLRALLCTESYRRGWRNVNWSMLIIALVFWISGTLNLAFGLLRLLQAFVYNTGPQKVTQLGLDWVNVAKAVTISLQMIFGDGVLVYRCWTVYGKSWIVAFTPIILWMGIVALTIWLVYIQANISLGSRLYNPLAFPVCTAMWGVTIFLNVLATSLIVYRIWTVDRENNCNRQSLSPSHRPARKTGLHITMKIIIESGLVYTLTSITVFISHLARSNALYITSAAHIMVIGIVFDLIIIRIAEHR